MAQIVVGGIFNAIAFSVAGFLFSKLNHQGYEEEMKRHNKALELLAKSKEEFYEQQVKRKGPFTHRKISSDKKISFVLNPLVAHGSSQNKEKLPVQGKFSCV